MKHTLLRANFLQIWLKQCWSWTHWRSQQQHCKQMC